MKKSLALLFVLSVFVLGCEKAQKVEPIADADAPQVQVTEGQSDEIQTIADAAKNKMEVEKDFAGALAEYDKALAIAEQDMERISGNAWLYADRGRAKFLLGDKQGAIADFSKAIELNADRGIFYQWRAEVYADLGNTASAEADKAMVEKLPKE